MFADLPVQTFVEKFPNLNALLGESYGPKVNSGLMSHGSCQEV